MGGCMMERIIRSGRVEEKYTFRVAPNTKPRAKKKKGATLPRKQDANERACTKRLARLINCNFTHGDLLLSPNWDEERLKALTEKAGGDLEALYALAEHELDLFLLRLRRELKKQDRQLRYIAITSDQNGETGELVRIHHHILIPCEGIEMRGGKLWIGEKTLESVWKNGNVDYQPLRSQEDYTPLAEYLMRQVRRKPDTSKYKASRNLAKPVLVSERLVYAAKELQTPKGAKIVYRAAYTPGEGQYIRYIRPVRQFRRKKRTGEDREDGKT